jgi:lipopolysaccharide transport system permease protein
MTKRDGLNLFRHLLILARHHELLTRMIRREISSRYRQTFLGTAWALIKPMATVVIFTLIFSGIAKLPSDELPYALFFMAGLLPWTLFSMAVTTGISSLTDQSNLVAKIYFPREILPLASMTASTLDFLIALLFLIVMMIHFRVELTWNLLYAIPILIIEILLIIGVTLFLSMVNVWYRDITHAAGLMLQLWMFLTPIIYPLRLVPGKYRVIYGLNPMVGIIEGFRSAVIKGEPPEPGSLLVSFGISVLVFFFGYGLFKLYESRLADVI